MPYTQINPTQTDALSPIDEQLMDVGLRQNFDDHESRLLALEAGGGVGSGAGEDLGFYGEIIGDKKSFSNEANYWLRKYQPFRTTLLNGATPEGYDQEGISKNDRFMWVEDRTGVEKLKYLNETDVGVYTSFYRSSVMSIEKDGYLKFKIKKGENFFGLSYVLTSNGCDNIEVYIDGQTPVALGLVDENGEPAANFINSSNAANRFQTPAFFFGLDGNEHVVEIRSNDSGADIAYIDAIYIGYKSKNYTINHKIEVKPGKAKVAGTQVTHAGGVFEFDKSQGGGYTGAIVCDNQGNLSKLQGGEPAMTQIRAEVEVEFSGPVTSLPVKSVLHFAQTGIGLLQTWWGQYHLFSWNGKTDATPQAQSLNNIVWKSKPGKNMTPESGFTVAAFGGPKPDININALASAPIIVSTANNKLDFQIVKYDDTVITRAATITNGAYAADMVSILDAIESAMRTAEPLKQGRFVVSWDEENAVYTISLDSDQYKEFRLPFSSGANQSNSIHATLGFADSDLNGRKTYTATTERRHKAAKIFQVGAWIDPYSPRVKATSIASLNNSGNPYDDVKGRMGFGAIRSFTSDETQFFLVHPDDDAVGMTLSFLSLTSAPCVTIYIDNGAPLYAIIPNARNLNKEMRQAHVVTVFVSFPRGSRTIRVEQESNFFTHGPGWGLHFMGGRQFHTRPALEQLTKNQKVLRAYDVAPISLYKTCYGCSLTQVYQGNPSGDNINTVSESGAWFSSTSAPAWNYYERQTTGLNDYVEVDFTIQKDGGFCGLRGQRGTIYSRKIGVFVSQVAINEATDRVQNIQMDTQTMTQYDLDAMVTPPLKAGTYKARFKNEDSGALVVNQGIFVVDGIEPDPHKYTVPDLTNDWQGQIEIVNAVRKVYCRDGYDKIPPHLYNSAYQMGKEIHTFIAAHQNWSFFNWDDAAQASLYHSHYYQNFTKLITANDIFQAMFFTKSMAVMQNQFASPYTTSVTGFIDSKQCPNTYSVRQATKNGAAAVSTRDPITRFIFKKFYAVCVYSGAGNVFNCTDTRGIRVNEKVMLFDGTNFFDAIVSARTDNVSFAVDEMPTGLTPANVEQVYFYGFHSMRIRNDQTADMPVNAFEYEPLDVLPSKHLRRQFPKTKLEKVSILFQGVDDGHDLFYPFHSDGVAGDWRTSTIEIVKRNTTSTTWEITPSLKNISVSGAGQIDIRITSTRMVAENTESY